MFFCFSHVICFSFLYLFVFFFVFFICLCLFFIFCLFILSFCLSCGFSFESSLSFFLLHVFFFLCSSFICSVRHSICFAYLFALYVWFSLVMSYTIVISFVCLHVFTFYFCCSFTNSVFLIFFLFTCTHFHIFSISFLRLPGRSYPRKSGYVFLFITMIKKKHSAICLFLFYCCQKLILLSQSSLPIVKEGQIQKPSMSFSLLLSEPVTCNSKNFICANGECISSRFRCDGDFDCTDNSDEVSSTTFISC